MDESIRGKLIDKLSEKMFFDIVNDYNYAMQVIKFGNLGLNHYSDKELIDEYEYIFDKPFDESEFVKGN